jgi:hypothetical protein
MRRRLQDGAVFYRLEYGTNNPCGGNEIEVKDCGIESVLQMQVLYYKRVALCISCLAFEMLLIGSFTR